MEFINRFTPLNFSNPINQGLVAYYPLNERTGPVAFDMSKNNFHGDLINAPTRVQSGRFGDVLDFDSTSEQYVDCGLGLGNSLGDGIKALSVSLWFDANVTSGSDGLFSIGDFLGSNGAFDITHTSSSSISLRTRSLSITSAYTSTSDWHNTVCMYTGSRLQIYLDGLKIRDVGHSTNLDLIGLKTVIGLYFATTRTLNGKLKQVRIYDRELQPSEIKTIFISRS